MPLPFLVPLIASVAQQQMAKNQQEEPTPFVNSGNAMARRQQQMQQQPGSVIQSGLKALSELNLPSDEAKKYAQPLLEADFVEKGKPMPATYNARRTEIA